MLEAHGLCKRYPGVVALEGVDFSVAGGEVVGLIGENGAGKSTLIKMLGGLTKPDSGTVQIDAKEVVIHDAAEATRLGIAVIHQELNNLDNLDLAGNVLLGREPRKWGFLVDRKAVEEKASVFLRRVGLAMDPSTPLSELSIAQQQLVEIAKALSMEARFLIMDEPTSSLTAGETEQLLKIIDELRAQGVGIVYVSHRLGEVARIADRVVGLRDGKNAGGLGEDEIEHESMVRLMVGRDLTRSENCVCEAGEARLVVEGLATKRFPGSSISFQVCGGEVVGIAGLVGSGRSELVRATYGVDSALAGQVVVDGKELPLGSPPASIAHGLFLAPEDRRKEGVLTSMCIRENVCLPSMEAHSSAGLVEKKRESKTATSMMERLSIKASGIESDVRNLSGGNQQKVALAKWLAKKPACIILDEPTRGIDVGARAEIYDIVRRLAQDGVAILVISSDMEEVLDLSDRILVMREGVLMGELKREEASEEAVMRLAVGGA